MKYLLINKMTEQNYNKEILEKAVKSLREGGVIVYPTETVWGIGCDATNADAVERVFAIKKRADSHAMLSLVANEVMLERNVRDIPEVAFELIEAAVEPLTVVLDHPVGIAPALLDADGSAAFRIAATPFCRELCRCLGRPVVSTSANFSGSPAPNSFSDIPEEIINAAEFVVDESQAAEASGKPSSIIKISDGGIIKIIRP